MGLILVEGPNFHFNSDWLYFWRKVFHLHLINIDIIISPSRWRLGSRRRWWYPHFSWQEVSFGKTANCRIKIRCAFFLKGPAQKLFSSPFENGGIPKIGVTLKMFLVISFEVRWPGNVFFKHQVEYQTLKTFAIFFLVSEIRGRKNVQTMEIINNIYWLDGRQPKRQD